MKIIKYLLLIYNFLFNRYEITLIDRNKKRMINNNGNYVHTQNYTIYKYINKISGKVSYNTKIKITYDL